MLMEVFVSSRFFFTLNDSTEFISFYIELVLP